MNSSTLFNVSLVLYLVATILYFLNFQTDHGQTFGQVMRGKVEVDVVFEPVITYTHPVYRFEFESCALAQAAGVCIRIVSENAGRCQRKV